MAHAPDTPKGHPPRSHERALAALARRGRLRRLTPAHGIDFTSNDYLGLANSPELRASATEAIARGVPVGAGGSRLLRGNHPEFEALESEAASIFGAQSALYFGGGFQANSALIATLPSHGDLLVFDEMIHASAWDGMAHTKADCRPARHNDVQSFADVIATWRRDGHTGRVYIAVESLYSMDGDLAPLADLASLAERHDAMLLIDEAHATGVLGPDGRGLAAAHNLEGRENVVTLHTCGKALGASGALLTGPRSVRDFLVNRARAFIYATAPSPLMAAVVRRALAIVCDEPQRRDQLKSRVTAAHDQLEISCRRTAPGTHIIPIIVGSDANAVHLANAMQSRGYDIRAIRPPTVPEGSARLRIAITNNVTAPQILSMMAALGEELGHFPLSPCSSLAWGEGRGEGQQGKEREGQQDKESEGQQRAPAQPATPHLSPLPAKYGERESHPPRFVVTGTGTGIGKTVFAAALVHAFDGDYWKPIQAGTHPQTDTERVRALTGLPAAHFHPEAYRLNTPASPHLAAMRDGVTIDPGALTLPTTTRPLVIEGAGGLLVPLDHDTLLIDVFSRWQLPVILVASTALGTINHTLLSLEALCARAIPIHGVAFVGEANENSEQAIANLGGVTRLGRLDHLTTLNRENLSSAFFRGFDLADFVAPARASP